MLAHGSSRLTRTSASTPFRAMNYAARPTCDGNASRREEKNGFGRRCQRAQVLRRRRSHSRRLDLHRRRRIRHPGRSVRLREIDASAHDRRPRVDRGRKDQDRRARRQQSRAEGSRHRDGVPELRALSPQDRRREHELRPQAAAHAEGRDRGAGSASRRNPACRALSFALSPPAFGRPAAAGRDGAGDRARSTGLSVRRAAVQSRRQAARADARRNQGAAPASEDDDDLRHARSGRGDDDGRPHRRHARRRGRADRRFRSTFTTGRRPYSSRASSARRR